MGREKFPLLGSGPGRLGSSPLLRKLPSAAAWRCVLVGMARGHLPGLSLLPSHRANSCSRSVLSQGSGGTGSLSRGASSSFEVAPGWGAGSCREKLAGVAAVGAGLLVGRPPRPHPRQSAVFSEPCRLLPDQVDFQRLVGCGDPLHSGSQHLLPPGGRAGWWRSVPAQTAAVAAISLVR